jgi:hypothetical protein
MSHDNSAFYSDWSDAHLAEMLDQAWKSVEALYAERQYLDNEFKHMLAQLRNWTPVSKHTRQWLTDALYALNSQIDDKHQSLLAARRYRDALWHEQMRRK